METRHPGPANLRNHNAVMAACYALQEKTLGFERPDSAGEAVHRRAQTIGALDDYPYLAEIARKLPGTGYDYDVEFVWGLDLILDGLDRLRHTGAAPA